MDVDFVTRTFYQNGDYSSDKMILLQKKQDNNQNIIAVFKDDKDVTTVSFENGDGFLKFIEDAKTVLNNPDKNLDYSFGASKNGKINKGIEDGTITLYVNLFNSTTHNYVNNAELDSMKSCYNRFISESQK